MSASLNGASAAAEWRSTTVPSAWTSTDALSIASNAGPCSVAGSSESTCSTKASYDGKRSGSEASAGHSGPGSSAQS